MSMRTTYHRDHTVTTPDEVVAALAGIADVHFWDGRGRISNYAPDSSEPEYNGDTSPGSEWDEECDWRLADIRAALPAGWKADWSDDDIIIDLCDEGDAITADDRLVVRAAGGTQFEAFLNGEFLGRFSFGELDDDGGYSADDDEIIDAARAAFGLDGSLAGVVSL